MSIKVGENRAAFLIIGINLFLVCGIIAVFLFYNARYQKKIEQQNIDDITNINHSAANVSSSFFLNQQKRLADVIQYAALVDFSENELLAFLCESNSDTRSNYELIGEDAAGYAAIREESEPVPVNYAVADYHELKKIFSSTDAEDDSEILCTPEFTDQYTALTSFALYRHIKIKESGKSYTLMVVFQSSDFKNQIALDGGYKDIATVLINKNGDYIFGSSSFKAENLFKYFYDYNGLNRDQMNQEADAFALGKKNIFYYKNSRSQNSIFICTGVSDTKWYAVTCVPISSFHNASTEFTAVLWTAVLLSFLMAFNLIWMKKVNRTLRDSVQKEKIASAAKTDFLSRMSHDIRTPLNVINGSALLAEKEENTPAAEKYLNNIEQSGKFLLSLVNDILDLNKVESGKMELYPEPYSLLQLKNSLCAIIAPLCKEKDIEFSITGCDSSDCYLLDSVRINQIFFNILSNSVKFTPSGGHIGLSCQKTTDAGNRTELHFTASDDGKGMSSEFQKSMFEAFSQENETAGRTIQGTGLGLAIVNNLVKLMSGSVRVKSEPGRGTEFQIILPVKETDEKSSPKREITAADLALLKGRHILLCEDNAINSEVARRLLEDKGMIITCASDGQEGLDIYRSSAINYFDLILMDIRMPVMNGLEASSAIRGLPRPDAREISIVAMTANAYDTDVKACLEAGMNAHISKPIDPEIMYNTIARYITRKE